MSEPMQDGPNTHRFQTFNRGTEFLHSTVVYPDGETHTFHIPIEALGPQKPIEVEVQEHIESLEAESGQLKAENQRLIDELHCVYSGMLALIEKAETINPDPESP